MLQGSVQSEQRGSGALQGGALRSPGMRWFLSLLLCMVVVGVAFVYVDVPIARRLYGLWGSAANLARGFTSAVILSAEAAVALSLAITRVVRGRLSPLGEAAALACLTSICAYAMDDNALKIFFGVPNPGSVVHGSRHVFHLLHGSANSSFPSGHMALAGAFAGVFMRLYRHSVLLFSILLLMAAGLLIAGDWHFVSDVIAGTFVGVSAGLLAGELWRAHSNAHSR